MRRVFVTAALLAALTVSLGACESDSTVQPLVAENDPVALRMTEAAEKATRALDDLASMRRMQTLPQQAPDPHVAPPILQQPLIITWDGPVEMISRLLAERTGYRLLISGQAPPVPITVSLDVYDKPLILVLYDVGVQLGARADLTVDSQQQRIELRYAAVDQYGR